MAGRLTTRLDWRAGHRTAVALIVSAVFLAGAACSSDAPTDAVPAKSMPPPLGDVSQGSAPPKTTTTVRVIPTKVEFLAKGNVECQKFVTRRVLSKRLTATGTPAENAKAFDELANNMDELLVALKALGVPVGEEAALAAIYQQHTDFVVLVRQLAEAERANDTAKVTEIQSQASPAANFLNDAFESYGLTECAKDN